MHYCDSDKPRFPDYVDVYNKSTCAYTYVWSFSSVKNGISDMLKFFGISF